jgi:hypothetical protein
MWLCHARLVGAHLIYLRRAAASLRPRMSDAKTEVVDIRDVLKTLAAEYAHCENEYQEGYRDAVVDLLEACGVHCRIVPASVSFSE